MAQQTDALNWTMVASIFSELNEYVLITDNDAGADRPPNVLYCNEGFEKHTGYTLAEIQEHSFSILAGPETDEEVMKKNKTVCQGGEVGAGGVHLLPQIRAAAVGGFKIESGSG